MTSVVEREINKKIADELAFWADLASDLNDYTMEDELRGRAAMLRGEDGPTTEEELL